MSERRARRSGLRLRWVVMKTMNGTKKEVQLISAWHKTERKIGEVRFTPWPVWEPE